MLPIVSQRYSQRMEKRFGLRRWFAVVQILTVYLVPMVYYVVDRIKENRK